MLTMEDLLNHRYQFADLDISISDQLMDILARLAWIENQPGNPIENWTCTSGLRTMEDHLRIYREKAEKAGVPFDESKVPMQSKHLYGRAADIYDPELKITAWLKANPEILEQAGLWCEEGNANWVHFQNQPPKSGNRWFLP